MSLRGDFSFDPLFTDDFFKLPPPSETKPEDLDPQVKFFRYYAAHEFFAPKFAITKLVNELESMSKTQGIFDAATSIAFEIFLSRFDYAKNTLEFNEKGFPLFTQGITQLAEIVAILRLEEAWSESRKTLIKEMNHLLGECPTGALTHICDARLALAADLPTQLMHFRRAYAEQEARKILIMHDVRTKLGGTLEVPNYTETHYINAMLNLYHADLSIPAVTDDDASHCGPTEAMQSEFTDLVSANLNATYILERILDSEPEALATLAAASPLSSEAVEKFGLWLKKYGMYTFRGSLIDEIANTDDGDNYRLNPHLNYYVLLALFHRLANSNFLDKSTMRKCTLESLPDITIFIPPVRNIKLAYVESRVASVSHTPFVIYYYQALLQEAADGNDRTTQLEALCQPDQLRELRDEVVNLISKDWANYVAANQASTVENFLVYFGQKFPSHLLALIRLIQSSQLDSEKLRSRLGLQQRVIEANDAEILFAYLGFFPRRDWHPIVLSDFHEMALMENTTLYTVVYLFGMFEALSPAQYVQSPERFHHFIDAANHSSPSLVKRDGQHARII